jgi:hypothetical protein
VDGVIEVVIGKRRPRLKVSIECTVPRRQLAGIYLVPVVYGEMRRWVKVCLHQPLLTRVDMDMCETKDKVLPGYAQR